MTIKDLPKHLRPREKMAEIGVENLSEVELLAVLLRTGSIVKSTNSNGLSKSKKLNALELAEYLINKYGLKNLLEMNYSALLQISGVNHAQACSIAAATELITRAFELEYDTLPEVHGIKQALVQLAELERYRKEYLVVLYLNAKSQLIHKENISVGILNSSLIHPREVFEPAVRHMAGSVILAHNHPSGDPEPSVEDIQVTKQLVEAGKIMGIKVVDHIIVGKNRYYSFLEEGLLHE